MGDLSTRDIIMLFDALDAGDVGLFLCNDETGTVGAHIEAVRIRAEHTVNSLCGYGATPDAALLSLWERATKLERTECLLIRRDSVRRGVRWNGAAWKPVELPPCPQDPA